MDFRTRVELAKLGYFCPFQGQCDVPVKKAFSIRQASSQDVDDLYHLEVECWGNLKVSKEVISDRIQRYPSGQWVVVVDQKIVGSMFTQLVNSFESFYAENVSFVNQSSLHADNNSTVQLMSLSVKEEFSHLQIGGALRDFVVGINRMNESIVDIVAVTRCQRARSVLHSESDYKEYVLGCKDPILKFHVGGGAVVVCLVPGYRLADEENYGHGILIRYQSGRNPSPVAEPIQNSVVSVVDSLSPAELRSLVSCSCSETHSKRIEDMSLNEFLSSSFMHLGMDSFQIMDVRNRISQLCPHAQVPHTLLFDYPTPQVLLNYLNRSPGQAVNQPQPTAKPTEPFAVCGLACRFPGQSAPDPESFFDFLCSADPDAVGDVPLAWRSKVRKAAFLSDEFAETFDPAYFRISAVEAAAMDPLHRILLEVSHEALQGAGVLASRDTNTVGVFVGVSNNEWIRGKALDVFSSTSTSMAIAANRLSYHFGFDGPSMVVDTACSSSLSALHTACNAINCGDCDIALVAAADLLFSDYSLQVNCVHFDYFVVV